VSERRSKKKLTDVELLEALGRMTADDLADEISAMSDHEVAGAIRAEGSDPEAIGERGAAFVADLLAKHKDGAAPPKWKTDAKARREAAEDASSKAPKISAASLSRESLLARIRALKEDPRFEARIAAAFRSRKPEESDRDELAALIDEIEGLAAIAAAEKRRKKPAPKKRAKTKKRSSKRG
jgi:hypothetical protein